MPIQSVNPLTGERLKTFPPLQDQEVDRKLGAAVSAFRTFKRMPLFNRAKFLLKAASILETEKKEWAKLITTEMGKPFRSSVEEIVKCASTCRYYAENGERFLADQVIRTSADQSYVRFQPLGPIFGIMPWNFPFWQVFRFAVPTLMAGNVVLLKHASNVPQCALAIEEIFRRSEFPDGSFQTLLITAHQADRLVEDNRIMGVSLTGSEITGAQVGRNAGKGLKKAVLELGGSDPFVVMPSADLEQTLQMAVQARIVNNGQSCIAAKRFILSEEIADTFENNMCRAMNALQLGDPMDTQTQVGPLATLQVLETLERQVQDSVKSGARVLCGGKRPDRPGFFYQPTVLAEIPREAPAYREEVFGPVALIFRVKNIDDAIRQANTTKYGLGASLWSSDPSEHSKFIEEIESGLCFINGIVASDPRLPFGGIKHSGFGRELSHFGMLEFINVKTVWVNTHPRTQTKTRIE